MLLTKEYCRYHLTFQCNHPDATKLMQSSCCYCPDSTISKNKSTPGLPYQLNASFSMLPSQCHIAELIEMVYNTILNAVTFLVKLEERNKDVVRRKFKNDGKKNGPSNLDAQALPSGCYHPDATILTRPSWSYHSKASILMLPSSHYHHNSIVTKLPSWCYCFHSPNATTTILPYCPRDTFPKLPFCHYHLNDTVTTHKMILYSLTLFQQSWKKEIDKWWKEVHVAAVTIIVAIAAMIALED